MSEEFKLLLFTLVNVGKTVRSLTVEVNLKDGVALER